MPAFKQSEQEVHGGQTNIGRDQINIYHDSKAKPTDPESLIEAHAVYLHWLFEQNQYLDPRGTFQVQRQVQLKLDEVYIGLRAQADDQMNNADRELLEKELAELEERLVLSDLSSEEQEERKDELFAHFKRKRDVASLRSQAPIPLAEATAKEKHLVILGDPGSGKTTLLRYLALQHALAIREGKAQIQIEPDSQRPQTAHPHTQSTLFPILIRIANYADEGRWEVDSLSDFLPKYFHYNECKEGITALLETRLKQGGCLLLLDGLDEIVEADDRRGIVNRIENFVRSYERGGPRGSNHFIITSRIAGYRSAPLGKPFAHYIVEEMDESQMARFLERWCRAVEDAQTADLSIEARHATAQREIDGIMQAIRTNPGVRRLASNPLMLRTLALIHRTGARLPQRRIELYKLAADTLARTWRTAQGVSESALVEDRFLTPLLSQLAYWMHEHKPTGLATEKEVYEQLGAAFAKRKRIPWDADEPDPEIMGEIDKFLLAVREHTGLFVERAPKRYGFMHLTFEEYYAARYLVARSRTRAQLIRQHLHVSRWEEPILLALGFVDLDYPDEAAGLLDTAILAWGEEAEALSLTASRYEALLGRDYLFALHCLGDQVSADPQTVDELTRRLSNEYLYKCNLACFQAYRNKLNQRLEYLSGNNITKNVIQWFLTALKDGNADVRSRAAAGLFKLGKASPEVTSALISKLKDEHLNVRSRAAESLGKLGQASPKVISALITVLKNDYVSVRSRAAESLGELGQASPEVISALITALKDENQNTRSYTAKSLGELGESSPAVIEALIAALKDGDWNVRNSAAGSLEKLGKASPEVISTLKDDDWGVRDSAAESQGESILVVIEALIVTLKGDDWDVRDSAAKSLGKLGKANPEVIPALIATLKDDDWNVRSRAAGSLGELGESSPAVIEALITALKDDDWNMRSRAAGSLGELGESSPAVIEALIAALKDDDWDVRDSAAGSLGKLGELSPAVIEAFIATFKDNDWNVCSLEVIHSLIAAIQQADSYQTRRGMAQLVGALDIVDQSILNGLHHGLLDEDDEVRGACATALATLGKRFPSDAPTIKELLVQAIGDPAFKKRDEYKNRTAQDYAYDGLWQLVVG